MRSMPGRISLAAVSLLCVVVLAACNCAPTLRYISVVPATASIDAGTTQQFTATIYYSDGSQKDATSTAQWSSSLPAVATVNSSGVATGLTLGTTNVSATFGGLTAAGALTVARVLQSITVAPAAATVAIGGTQNFTATGTYLLPNSMTQTVDVTSVATWNSSDSTKATIDNTGLGTGVATGTTKISATLDGVTSNNATLAVGGVVVVGLKVTPNSVSVAIGNAVTLTALELKSDNTTQPLTGTVVWSSVSPGACAPNANLAAGSVNGAEIVSGAAVTTTACTVTATEGSLSGTAAVSVIPGTASYGYIGDNNGSAPAISQFKVDATSTTPITSLTPAAAGTNNVSQVVVHPNGLYAYAVDVASRVTLYEIAPATSTTPAPGTLNFPTTTFSILAGSGSGGNTLFVEPSGRFLYVLDPGASAAAGSISGFTISQTDGTLTAIGAVTAYTTNISGPGSVLSDGSGKYLYIINNNGDLTTAGEVSAYSINSINGALTPLSTPTIATGKGPFFGAISSSDPANPYFYVANSSDNTVSEFKIDPATGLLSAIGTSAAISGAFAIDAAVVDPTGKNIYLIDTGDGTNPGHVYGFNIGTGGVIGTTAITGTPVVAPVSSELAKIDPTGKLLVVDSNGTAAPNADMIPYAIGTGGALTADTAVTIGNAPFGFVFGITNQ